jgi:hypothetical protein
VNWSDTVALLGMLGFIGFTIWVASRPTSSRGGDKTTADLRTLKAELVALSRQVDRMADGNGSRPDSRLTREPSELS